MMLCSDNAGTSATQIPASNVEIKSDQPTTEPPLVVSAVELMPTTSDSGKQMTGVDLTKDVVGTEGSRPKRTMVVSRPRVHPHQKQLEAREKLVAEHEEAALAKALPPGCCVANVYLWQGQARVRLGIDDVAAMAALRDEILLGSGFEAVSYTHLTLPTKA